MKPTPIQVGSLLAAEALLRVDPRRAERASRPTPGSRRRAASRTPRGRARVRPAGARRRARGSPPRALAPKSSVAPSTWRKSGKSQAFGRTAAIMARLPDHQDRGAGRARAREPTRARCRRGSRTSARSSGVIVSPACRELLGELRAALLVWHVPPAAAERVHEHPEHECAPRPRSCRRSSRPRARARARTRASAERPTPISGHGEPGSAAGTSRSRSARSACRARTVEDAGRDGAAEEEEGAGDVEHQAATVACSRRGAYALVRMETRDRHLKLLTDTIEAVNSTLDLQEVLVAGRDERRRRARRRCVLRLPLRRARRRARPARDARHARSTS